MALRTIRWLAALVACAAAAVSVAATAAVRAVSIGTFELPTYVTVAPGAPTLLFVVEQAGRIQVLVNEAKQATPFLDIADLVFSPPDAGAGGEQGLLSIAFAPNYQKSGLFYVSFVNVHGSLEIDEFRRSQNQLVATRSSRRIVLAVRHPGATNHNAGQMQFAPGGLLFITTGDGGGISPQGEPARDLNDLRGKLLRIDPVRRGPSAYKIPADNPFAGKPGRDEIYSYGFRNPWRFSIDNTRIAIGDVGQSRQEEVDFLTILGASGVNFGWPQYEGNLLYDASRPGQDPPKFPMFFYDHTNGRCAIIGGYVVRGTTVPSLRERYLYGDACTGEVRSFAPNVARQVAVRDQATGIVLPGLSSFGKGFGGQIYMAQTSGGVSRLVEDAP